MKKSRLLMILMSAVMAFAMCFAFAGCGEQDGQAEDETAETTVQAEEPAALDDSFNLAEALSTTGLLEAMDETGVDYYIEQDSNVTETFYLSACADGQDFDGMVGFITAYAEGDTSYEDLPDYRVMGEKDGVTFVVSLATDVRIDVDDPQQSSDYELLTEVLKTFNIQ